MEKTPPLTVPLRLVVDANILLAGLLRASTTRSLPLDARLTLFAPEHLLLETAKHVSASARLRQRIGLPAADIRRLLSLLTSGIEVVPRRSTHLLSTKSSASHRTPKTPSTLHSLSRSTVPSGRTMWGCTHRNRLTSSRQRSSSGAWGRWNARAGVEL